MTPHPCSAESGFFDQRGEHRALPDVSRPDIVATVPRLVGRSTAQLVDVTFRQRAKRESTEQGHSFVHRLPVLQHTTACANASSSRESSPACSNPRVAA